jgi:hypothetical protein
MGTTLGAPSPIIENFQEARSESSTGPPLEARQERAQYPRADLSDQPKASIWRQERQPGKSDQQAWMSASSAQKVKAVAQTEGYDNESVEERLKREYGENYLNPLPHRAKSHIGSYGTTHVTSREIGVLAF